MNRFQRTALTAAGLAAVGAGFFALYRQTEVISTAERCALRAKELRVLQLDSELRRTALEARYGLVNQYDSLAATASEFETAAAEWSGDLACFAEPEDWALISALETLSQHIEEQRRDLERFKSRNSILKNSLRYLPKAVLELRAELEDAPRFAELRQRADSVMFQAFMLSSFREQSYGKQLRAELVGLQTELEQLQVAGLAPDSAPLRRGEIIHVHGKVCLREISGVEAILTELRERPIRAAVTAIDQVLNDRITEMESRAAIFRGLLYGLTAILGLALILVAGWLRRLYATLEQRVADRTADLQAANDHVQQLYDSNRLVLDNVYEGLATIDLDGQISAEMSTAARRWFGEPAPGETAMDWLRHRDPGFADALDLGLESLRDGFLPQDLLLEQLPDRLEHDGRTIAVTFRPIDTEPLQLLLVAEDITERLANEREEARNRQVVTLAQRLGRDRAGTVEFLRDANDLIDALRLSADMAVAQRRLHTLKGNAAIFGLEAFATNCHQLEDVVEEERRLPSTDEIDGLAVAWRDLMAEISPFCGDLHGSNASVQISREDLAELEYAIERQAPHDELRALVDWWSLEPLADRFTRMAEQISGIARRLGHEEPHVEFDDAGLRLEPDEWREFWSATGHVLRNIVDHGIESPHDRQASQKAPQGRVRFSAHLDEADEGLTIRFTDDGRGVDWDKIRQRAAELGLPCETQAELERALFEDRVSTRDQVSETSGRGAGMSAVRSACESIGGTAEIHSEPGHGTELVFRFGSEHPMARRHPVVAT